MRTCILKHDILNLVSFATRHLNIKTLYHYFGHVSDEVIYYILNNIKNVKKIHFPIQKYIYYNCTFGKIYQHNFSENTVCFSELLELIHSDLFELPILSYSKYKWVIIFLDNYSFYCNIAFLCKKSEATKVIKSIFQMWSNCKPAAYLSFHNQHKYCWLAESISF